MPQIASIELNEKGTGKVTIVLKDTEGLGINFADISSPQWRLTLEDGTVVNERTYALSTLTSLTWVLTGEDLAIIGDSDTLRRIISFKCTYNSALGSNLPLHEEIQFSINPLVGIDNNPEI